MSDLKESLRRLGLRIILHRRPGWEREIASDDLMAPEILKRIRGEAEERDLEERDRSEDE